MLSGHVAPPLAASPIASHSAVDGKRARIVWYKCGVTYKSLPTAADHVRHLASYRGVALVRLTASSTKSKPELGERVTNARAALGTFSDDVMEGGGAIGRSRRVVETEWALSALALRAWGAITPEKPFGDQCPDDGCVTERVPASCTERTFSSILTTLGLNQPRALKSLMNRPVSFVGNSSQKIYRGT